MPKLVQLPLFLGSELKNYNSKRASLAVFQKAVSFKKKYFWKALVTLGCAVFQYFFYKNAILQFFTKPNVISIANFLGNKFISKTLVQLPPDIHTMAVQPPFY